MRSMEARAELARVQVLMRRVLELDEAYYYGGAHIFMGILEASKPIELGRDSRRFIGTVSTDSPTRFSLKFLVPRTAGLGTSNLTVLVVYQDSLGNTYRTSRGLTVSIVPRYLGKASAAPRGILGELRQLADQLARNHLLQAIWGVVLALAVLALIVVFKTRPAKRELEGIEAI